MEDSEIISCPNGHRLRVPTTKGKLVVTCPSCHTSFDWPQAIHSADTPASSEPTTPRQYEELVAQYFREQGYATQLTPQCNDYGVDAFATKPGVKLAVQAKMYGGSVRKINREMVMQLHGAKDYFDCTKAVIVTDGALADTARVVALKLGIEIIKLSAAELGQRCTTPRTQFAPSQFDDLWKRYVMPLAGQTLRGPRGRTNTILKVDWAGVERVTSNGKTGRIEIEIFKRAVARVFERGSISREEINEWYAKRASSGVVLILSQIPLFEHVSSPSGIRLK